VPLKPRDNKKRYRFTPKVSKRRMLDPSSVDRLYGFGAENQHRCVDSAQPVPRAKMGRALFSGHFRFFSRVLGAVMVRSSEKCSIEGRVFGPILS